MTHCLDAWAILAWLDGEEPAAGKVDEIFAVERPVVSWINLVEVEYRLRRDQGADEAEYVLRALRPTVIEDLPGIARMRGVAKLKSEHPIALGDCFAVVTAVAEGAKLATGDPEILDRADALGCPVVDLRRS